MPRANLDDGMAFHRKIIAAGNEAVGAWVRLISLSNQQLSDGRLTHEQCSSIAPKRVITKLVAVGLAHDLGDTGIEIHDFHDYSEHADAVRARRAALSEERSRAGRIGAATRWQLDGKAYGKRDSKPMAIATPAKWQTDSPSPSPSPSPDSHTHTARDPVVEALLVGRDLYPPEAVPDGEIAEVATRIRRAVLAEPKAARDGVTPEIAAAEAVAALRAWAPRYPASTPEERVGRVERHATDYVLRDVRADKRRAKPVAGPGTGGLDPDHEREERLRLVAQHAERFGAGGGR